MELVSFLLFIENPNLNGQHGSKHIIPSKYLQGILTQLIPDIIWKFKITNFAIAVSQRSSGKWIPPN